MYLIKLGDGLNGTPNGRWALLAMVYCTSAWPVHPLYNSLRRIENEWGRYARSAIRIWDRPICMIIDF